MSMTTAFLTTGELHAVHMIRQKGLAAIRAIGLCTADGDAGEGIYQVPSWAFDGRPKYGEITVCPKCTRAMKSLETPPKSLETPPKP